MAFCRKLSLVKKHGVTNLNPKASVRASSATSSPPKKSKAVPTSSDEVKMSFFFTKMSHCLSNFWNGNCHQCLALSSHFTEPKTSPQVETPWHIVQWRYFPA
ncbi:hypothetical protein TNCV_4478321 [Trichonephila clavipes]|nr:hypothetical protein TNCV_4478321 [Trichonephila clavipes]